MWSGGRRGHVPVVVQASRWSIIPAAWSFMLAARARGLGSVWTTFHLRYEREAVDILGIPFDQVMQAALIPVAYTLGTDFRPAARHPLDTMVHWDRWQAGSSWSMNRYRRTRSSSITDTPSRRHRPVRLNLAGSGLTLRARRGRCSSRIDGVGHREVGRFSGIGLAAAMRIPARVHDLRTRGS
jgi:Nitroreductase family